MNVITPDSKFMMNVITPDSKFMICMLLHLTVSL